MFHICVSILYAYLRINSHLIPPTTLWRVDDTCFIRKEIGITREVTFMFSVCWWSRIWNQIYHIPKPVCLAVIPSCLVDISHKIGWCCACKEPTSMVQVPRLGGWRSLQRHDSVAWWTWAGACLTVLHQHSQGCCLHLPAFGDLGMPLQSLESPFPHL